MEHHFGRLIDHVHIVVTDLPGARTFYDAVLAALGRKVTAEGEGWFTADEMFISDTGADGSLRPSTLHLAFQTTGKDQVRAFHAAAIAHGGTDNGAPGPRDYHPGYFAAYAIDPSGNNIEAVWHGPAERSAQSVTLTPMA